jgi:serine O-acetyltransferase
MAGFKRRLELCSEEAIWPRLRRDALEAAKREPALAGFLHSAILNRDGMADALAFRIAEKLSSQDLNAVMLRDICAEAYDREPALIDAFERDICAVRVRDPACRSFLQPFLYFKGFAAIQAYRVANYLWRNSRETLAFHLQSQISEVFQVDIHPAAKLGAGLFFDHATGIVIGETSTVGEDVSILHGVTLGGTGKERRDRHPKIGRGVLISVGAKILGNIRIGDDVRVAAGSVVLNDVPARATVAGVPARIVRLGTDAPPEEEPSITMDHYIGEGI